MAILDREMIMSNAQAVTTAAATPSTDIIDFGVAGAGKDKKVIVSVNASVTSGVAATVTFAVQDSVDAAFTSPNSLFTTAAIGKATLVAGYQVLEFTLPATVKRFVRVLITPAVGDLTAGKFNAYVDTAIQTNMIV
jgi:hypothetical protein